MPDQEVLINDSNLNAIANAIRRKNGLVRTYKPREMAPAILAINADAPDSREYTVTVIQTPHQTIKVRQVLGGEKQYDQSFTVSEPYWKIQASIEADEGYVAGGLNYPDEVTLDRDITIKASPATPVPSSPDKHANIYIGGQIRATDPNTPYGQHPNYSLTRVYSDDSLQYQYHIVNQPAVERRPLGRVVYNFIDEYYNIYGQPPYIRTGVFSCGGSTYESYNWGHPIPDATDIINNVQLNGTTTISQFLWGGYTPWLEYIDLSSLDMSTVESISELIACPQYLKSYGNISHWDTRNLKSVYRLVWTNQNLRSLDVSHWNTQNLEHADELFSGEFVETIDISGWDTTKLQSFSFGYWTDRTYLERKGKYLIMDAEEIKFSGSLKCYHPNNTIKYLVPESMVSAYKQHPNWSAWANQIDSLQNYTINRGDGQIEVVPNW